MLAHVAHSLLLAAHRAVIIFRVQALVMNVMLGTVFLRLRPEQATLAATGAPVACWHALAVNAALATVDAYVQFA